MNSKTKHILRWIWRIILVIAAIGLVSGLIIDGISLALIGSVFVVGGCIIEEIRRIRRNTKENEEDMER